MHDAIYTTHATNDYTPHFQYSHLQLAHWQYIYPSTVTQLPRGVRPYSFSSTDRE